MAQAVVAEHVNNIVQLAWQALKMGNPFTIEMLMSIAALGALAVMADTGATVLVTLNALYLLRYRFNEIG